VGFAVLADDDGGDAGGVGSGHGGALEVLVVGAGAVVAAADDGGDDGFAVPIDEALGAQDLLRGGGEDGAGDGAAAGAGVGLVAAGSGEIGLFDAVDGVAGLDAFGTDGGDGDDALGFGGDVEAGVVDAAGTLGARGIVGAAGVRGGMAEIGGAVADGADERHVVPAGVVEGALHADDDAALLHLLGFGVRGVVLAVEEPGVDVVAHVDDVDAVVGGIGQGVHAGLEEEHPGVLTRAEVDEGDPGGDAGDAQVVDGRGDGAGDVGSCDVDV